MMKYILIFLLLVVGCITLQAQSLQELQNSSNFKKGVELLSGDNPDESGALESFKKEIAEHPKKGYAYYYMGLVYEQDERY